MIYNDYSFIRQCVRFFFQSALNDTSFYVFHASAIYIRHKGTKKNESTNHSVCKNCKMIIYE